MTEEQQNLERELELAEYEYEIRFKSAPNDLDWNGLNEYMSSISKKVSEINRKLRLIMEPTFSELSTFGDVMSLDRFIDYVNMGGFIDYDGYGLYVKDDMESNIEIYPSDVKHNSIRTDFDTIIWFNR